MSVDEGVNGMFYLSIATLLCTFMTLSIKYCYKSNKIIFFGFTIVFFIKS